MKTPDLNDLQFFAIVVEHGGYAAAERALGIPKSRLSRRITQLEADLGVRLLQRSTRKFSVTEIGQNVYRHAQSMLAEAQAAREVVERVSAEPRGTIKVSTPVSLAEDILSHLLPMFMLQYPKVKVHLHVSNRRVDVINEGFDIALRVRNVLTTDADFVLKRFGNFNELLVASPEYLKRRGVPQHPQELSQHTTLSMNEDEARQRWELHADNGGVEKVDITPCLKAHSFPVLHQSAIQGVGIALLPQITCCKDLKAGRLQKVLPDWHLPLAFVMRFSHRALAYCPPFGCSLIF